MSSASPPQNQSQQSKTSRERSGCLTCRQRKKKCDGIYPICDQCRRLNFTCEREDPRKPKSRAGRPPRSQAISTSKSKSCSCVVLPQVPNLTPFWPRNGARDNSSSRRVVMRYYIQSFTTLLTTTIENNCFLSVFLPMSMESPLLLDAITAWSSSHLALRDNSYEPVSIANRCVALSSLSKSLSSLIREPEMELASCLIHCAMESITGDTSQWFNHLVGAYEVIRSIASIEGSSELDLSRFATTFEGRWLLRSFAYHDIMMAVAEDRKPFIIVGEYWNMGEEATADSYFGLASRLMYLVSEISILNADMLDAFDTGATEQFSGEARRIQNELLAWTCAPSENGMLINLAEAYRSAALIHLWRTIRRHRPQLTSTLEPKMQMQVSQILERVKEMPAGCLAESSMLFPLFMAGGEADDVAQICVVRQRMKDIVDTRHFHNVEAVLIVLEEVWHLRAVGVLGSAGRKVDWKDVLVRRKWKLSIT